MVAYPFRGWTEPGLQTLWHFSLLCEVARWRLLRYRGRIYG